MCNIYNTEHSTVNSSTYRCMWRTVK